MSWRVHGIFLTFRTLSFASSHIFWIISLLSGCAYFQLWKSYDIFWLWVYLVTTCVAPRLRYDNLFLQCAFLWRKRCCGGERLRYALKEQDRRIDEEDDRSAKITNSIDLGVTLLRLRVSAAILFGNVYLIHLNHESSLTSLTQFQLAQQLAFQISVWIDLLLFWFLLLFTWCKQCYLCCQLGCLKYYLWCIVVVVIGAILMELPMYFAVRCLDRTWCKLILWSNNSVAIMESSN